MSKELDLYELFINEILDYPGNYRRTFVLWEKTSDIMGLDEHDFLNNLEHFLENYVGGNPYDKQIEKYARRAIIRIKQSI